jgi:hypothetical protein
MKTKLNKAGQAEAMHRAAGILKHALTFGAATDAAYRIGMHALNNSRSRRDWRIADEIERIVRDEIQKARAYVNGFDGGRTST